MKGAQGECARRGSKKNPLSWRNSANFRRFLGAWFDDVFFWEARLEPFVYGSRTKTLKKVYRYNDRGDVHHFSADSVEQSIKSPDKQQVWLESRFSLGVFCSAPGCYEK